MIDKNLDPRIHIVPDAKDLERAESARRHTDDQVRAMMRSIKDPAKALRRGIAMLLAKSYDGTHRTARQVAAAMFATDEQLVRFDATVKEIEKRRSEEFEAKQKEERQKITDTIPKGLVTEIGGDRMVQITRKSRKKYGRIYAQHFFSTFNGTKFVFYESGTDRQIELDRTYSNYGNDLYKAEVRVIIKYKVKEANQ